MLGSVRQNDSTATWIAYCTARRGPRQLHVIKNYALHAALHAMMQQCIKCKFTAAHEGSPHNVLHSSSYVTYGTGPFSVYVLMCDGCYTMQSRML